MEEMIERHGITAADLMIDPVRDNYEFRVTVSRHVIDTRRESFEELINRMAPECVAVALALAKSQGQFASRRMDDLSHENRHLRDVIRRIMGQEDISPWI